MNRMKAGIIAVAVAAVVSAFGVVSALEKAPAGDSAAILTATGMTCGSCAARIETALSDEKGVESVQVDVAAGRVAVVYDSKQVKPEQLAEKVTATGYGSRVLSVTSKDKYTASATGAAADDASPGCGCCNRKNSQKEKL